MNDSAIRFGRIAAGIGVADMERAVAFYTDVLGFAPVFRNGDPVIFAIMERDAAELHLLLAPGYRGPAFNVAHLFVDDVDALHARCVAHDVPIVKAIADKDYGMRAFVIEDPDGNRIDIGQP
ncbi:glyoxalase superfamily protein [Sandarakinorhabdus sp. DWP1-3-1]|uniref:glyoxalase superfamily protein n=1 Tax=Sandarakinorhabdus sp. DWP1-3-1 TaxID=2804627 RepID=UPI003CF2BF55